MRAAPTSSVAAVVVSVLVAGATALVPLLERHRPSEVDAIVEGPVLPAKVSRFLSFGFGSALADIAYLQAIQVVAHPSKHNFTVDELAKRGLAAYRLLEYTTDVDPLFAYAYVLAANAIPVEQGDGTARNVNEAVRILEKGIENITDDWRIPFNLAFMRSAYLGDYSGAASAMSMAARIGKGPAYLPLLATRLAAQGGAIETGLALAAAMRDNAVDDEQREAFEARLRLLEMERDLRIIEAAAERFAARHGYRPGSIQSLLASGDLEQVPLEPHGGSYYYDALMGQARSTASARMRVFGNQPDKKSTVADERPPESLARDDSVQGYTSIGTGAP